jgi:starch phosphorylase
MAGDTAALRLRLEEFARNLWWTWQPDVIDVFRLIDSDGWLATNHNPIALLARMSDADLAAAVAAHDLAARIDFQHHRLQEYLLAEDTWCADRAGVLRAVPIGYFSAEFGIHESLPLYSGGLGLIAGDHLKGASDLGVPVFGVGLFYANGYFTQRLDESGWQREEYGRTPVPMLPLRRASGADDKPLLVGLPCGSHTLHAAVWLAHVGRAMLLLLDSDVEENDADDRALTSRLYGGDERTRLRQEMLLGIGGLRAFRAIGVRPRILHLNEGHSAFAILERTRERIAEEGFSFDDAFEETASGTVFTSHTPVPAGNDRFSNALIDQHLGWLRDACRIDQERLIGLGRVHPEDAGEPFGMTVLALRGARHRNAVSTLHGHVSRRMWQPLFGGRAEDVPIGHVTNGVHTLTWLAPSMKRLFDRLLGPAWPDRQAERETWTPLADVDPAELWEIHSTLRAQLVDFLRVRAQVTSLDPEVLTLGFARRFATYKRATLLFSDRERLRRLIANPQRPVQIVLAGKAHPRDDPGKRLLQEIVALSRQPGFKGRVVFVEDYDMNVARQLVRGVDVWVNTPQRPLEACGTSGQKVVLNGGLNLSTLDGWWAEAYDGQNGFAVGSTFVHADAGEQWRRDAASLYDALERLVVPSFYERDASGLPRRWIARMCRSILTLPWRFNAQRMVTDYVERYYLPASGS